MNPQSSLHPRECVCWLISKRAKQPVSLVWHRVAEANLQLGDRLAFADRLWTQWVCVANRFILGLAVCWALQIVRCHTHV